MRKLICLLIAAVLCLSMAAPAFAAENGFVPSITYKPEPGIVPADGGTGVLRNEDGDILDYIREDCIRVTPVADVYDPEQEVPWEIGELLRSVYESLADGTMDLPFEEFGDGHNSGNMVIRDLFDARMICEEHRKLLEEDGVTLDLTFDLGVAPDEEVFVMTYDEQTREWTPVAATVNNGDGTVTCTFEDLGIIAFSVQTEEAPGNSGEVQQPGVLQWIASVFMSVVGFLEDLIDRILKWF